MRVPGPGKINSESYWDHRFATGDWESKAGRWQTESFARGQVIHLGLPSDFQGTLVDFGCGLGDAIPIYRTAFPLARLIGVDISSSAVQFGSEHFGHMAEFIHGDYSSVPEADVIVASNVMEHLDDDHIIVNRLLSKCKLLFVVVPYKEQNLCSEHLRTYDENAFKELEPNSWIRFPCFGWSQFGFQLFYEIYFKNIIRSMLGRPIRHRALQILFKFRGSHARIEF